MQAADILKFSLKNLRRNKGRTFATMVGVILGTMLVVLIIGIGEGARQSIVESMQSNTDLMLITAYPYYGWGEKEDNGKHLTEINDTTLAQIRHLDGVDAVTPLVYAYFGMDSVLVNGKYEAYCSFTAVDMEAFLKFVKLSEGTAPRGTEKHFEFIMSPVSMVEFRDPNARDYEWVDVYSILMEGGEIPLPDIDFLGSDFTLRLTYYDYDSITSLHPEPDMYTMELPATMTGIIEQDPNDFTFSYGTYVDIAWLRKFVKANKKLLTKLGSVPVLNKYDTIYIKAKSVDEVATVLQGLNDMGVQYSSPMQWIEELQASTNKTQMFLMCIAMFTTLASVMSIYNTISMSVQERRREIGIMKVLGCSLSAIRAMFLSEAMLIGLAGGAAGIGLSFLVKYLISSVPAIGALLSSVMGTYDASGLKVIITPLLAAGSLAGAALVSVLSGYIPAQRAMKLSAQEAIRSI